MPTHWPDPRAAALAQLDTLPERQREVLYLSACEGLEHEEIAEVLGCTRDAVKTNLSLARRKMRAWLATANARAEKQETIPSAP